MASSRGPDRNDIMNFKQLDHEHVVQAWERMKLMIRNCPTHGLNLWMIIQIFYAGLNFASRNLLDLAVGGMFMEITLGDTTKLLYTWFEFMDDYTKNLCRIEFCF